MDSTSTDWRIKIVAVEWLEEIDANTTRIVVGGMLMMECGRAKRTVPLSKDGREFVCAN